MRLAPTDRQLLIFALLTLTIAPARLYAHSAEATASVLACGGGFDSDGGNDFTAAVAQKSFAGLCGPGPDDTSTATAAAFADIANGVVYASGAAQGVVGSNRATGRGQFTDFLFISAPAGIDTVQIEASIDLVADYTGAFDFSQDLLFGRVSVDSVGMIEIRRCTPFICPGNPIVSDSVSQVFTLERGAFSGEFPQINVSLETAIDVVAGEGYFAGAVAVTVVDGSGAMISSDSGVFGTGGGFDTDADTVPDALDNCRLVPNPGQRDTNGDGFGNICDADLDDSLFINFVDLGLMRGVFFTGDPDADLDGDGVVNFVDLAIMRGMFFGPPGPGAD